jgi:predicted outer membrane repeat protein
MKITLAVLFIPALAFSATIYVPDDHSTIQAAINAAVNGDSVIVRQGFYLENLDFLGKAITVKSESGPGATVIEGWNPVDPERGSVVLFATGEGPGSVLEGFTLFQGWGTWLTLDIPAYYGGGICIVDASPTITGNIITGCETRTGYNGVGGGIFCTATVFPTHASPVIKDNEIEGNVAENFGGGIYCIKAAPTVEHNVVTGNHGYNCGGIGVKEMCLPTIIANTVTGNWDENGEGGGISIRETTCTVQNNVIGTNRSKRGGGINVFDSNGTIAGNTLFGNEATQYGGGIYCSENGGLDITGNRIESNTAVYSGGGIYCLGGFTDLIGNTVCNNFTEGTGGGIYCTDNRWNLRLLDNLICGNTAVTDAGGLAMKGAPSWKPVITNCTITRNASPGTGGLLIDDTSPVITNCIVWNNAGVWGMSMLGNSDPKVEYSDIQVGWPGTGNIDADPLFLDPMNGDFHLTYPSPCRDAGTNDAPEIQAEDIEGDPRTAGGTADMGADEFHTHLYYTGNATPLGTVQGKMVGMPGSTPVALIFGSGVADPPLPTPWGPFHLSSPILLVPLVPIPSSGVLVLSATVPLSPPAPYDAPMQALIGLDPDSLTNLCVLKVR